MCCGTLDPLKVDAMRLSRFDRTLYLDADIRVLADPGDMFEVLDRFDIALAQDQNRNSPQALTEDRQPFPNAFRSSMPASSGSGARRRSQPF